MKALKYWIVTFRVLGCTCLVLLILGFLLTSPAWNGSSEWWTVSICLTFVFFVASIILSVVQHAIEESISEIQGKKER